MRTFFLSMAGALVAMFLFFFLMVIFFVGIIFSATSSAPDTPDNIVLSMDLNAEYSDQAPVSGIAAFPKRPDLWIF
jgi:protease-4